MMDMVLVVIIYDDWIEILPFMERWLAEVILDMIAGGYQVNVGHEPRRARIAVPDFSHGVYAYEGWA